MISKNYYLHQSARDGYRSYLQAYGSYSLKRIFDIHSLDLVKVSRAFGFKVPPKVNLGVGVSLKGSNVQGGKRSREEIEEGQEEEQQPEEEEEEEEIVVQGDKKAEAYSKNISLNEDQTVDDDEIDQRSKRPRNDRKSYGGGNDRGSRGKGGRATSGEYRKSSQRGGRGGRGGRQFSR